LRRKRNARGHQLLSETHADIVIVEVTDKSDPAMAVVDQEPRGAPSTAGQVQIDLSDATHLLSGPLSNYHARRPSLAALSRAAQRPARDSRSDATTQAAASADNRGGGGAWR